MRANQGVTQENKGIKIPGWVIGVLPVAVMLCSVVVWAYSTFVPRTERDIVKSMMEQRLERIESKQDVLNAKIDEIIRDRHR